jgi:hypothetical protein
MGGKNHQPCSEYLVNSTKLSRAISLGRIRVEQANVALEDLLLTELETQVPGEKAQLLNHLAGSALEVENALRYIGNLRAQMNTKSFKDLPLFADQLGITQLGARLVEEKMVDQSAWDVVADLAHKHGFSGCLDHFEQQLDHIKNATHVLTLAVRNNTVAIEEGRFHEVVEHNELTNIKVAFATLYTLWNQLDAVFLASSMLSTQAWYQHSGRPDIVPMKKPLRHTASV